MKILFRHSDADSADRLAMHAENLLRRVLDDFCQSIDVIEVKLKTSAVAGGRPEYCCTLKAKLISDDSVQAAASDCEAILAVYRAADRVKFILEQRLKSEQNL